jgi:hypothetical protein
MPDPLDDFGKAYRELLDAPDGVIGEIAAPHLRDARTRGRFVDDAPRIKAARAIQQQRESERRRSE